MDNCLLLILQIQDESTISFSFIKFLYCQNLSIWQECIHYKAPKILVKLCIWHTKSSRLLGRSAHPDATLQYKAQAQYNTNQIQATWICKLNQHKRHCLTIIWSRQQLQQQTNLRILGQLWIFNKTSQGRPHVFFSNILLYAKYSLLLF